MSGPEAAGVRRVPAWLWAAGPLALVAVLVAVFLSLGGPGLERTGVPVEDLAVERTTLRPGVIEVAVRNDGPDAVEIAQVVVNDAFVPGAVADPPRLGRLGASTVRIPYDWIEGEAYEIGLVTSTGAVVGVPVEVATETPQRDASFLGLLALLGVYVGIIPVSIGMLWLPFVRQASAPVLRFLLGLTIGLLAFLAIDAVVEGVEVAGSGPQVFGGAGLVFAGGLIAYLALSAVDAWAAARRRGRDGMRLATLVATGIGLHNLGEGLAIGAAYAVGELALGSFLVVGFALHNTTEGLAVVTPIAHEPVRMRRLVLLGVLAGAPAVAGAWLGGLVTSASLAALLLGFGAGAIVQVVVNLVPLLRPGGPGGRAVTPLTAAGMAAGMVVMYLTGLLVAG